MNSFSKISKLEDFLKLLGDVIEPSEAKLRKNEKMTHSPFPTVIKIGSPRVGGTLLTQWASSGDAFFNPTNLMSRFYATPIVGSLINQLLANSDFDYRDEFSDIVREHKFDSEIGKTSGVLSPHEFWYFWRYFLNVEEIPVPSDQFLKNSRFQDFSKSLKGMQSVSGKSMFLKGHLINFHIEEFYSQVPDVLFFYLKRNIHDTARSLYHARVKWTGSENNWFSHKPPQYAELKLLDPVSQVVGQIYFIEKEVSSKVAQLGSRCFTATYRDLCVSPEMVYTRLVDRANAFSEGRLSSTYRGPEFFTHSEREHTELDSKIEDALQYFIGKYGDLDSEE